MIGDQLIIKPYHLPPARAIYSLVKSRLNSNKQVINISGESGSGKSTLAMALRSVLEENGHQCFIFHMDDYFRLPPTSNHRQRLSDINYVGTQEVNLQLLQDHVDAFLKGVEKLEKPLIHYRENEIRTELADLKGVDILITEGTYTSLLQNILTKVFLTRDYKMSYEDRLKRGRDPIEPFIEDVLQIEHLIIKKHMDLADILVDDEYNVKVNK